MLEMTCQILFFLSPLILVAIANGLCIKYEWFRRLKRPLDLGRSFRGRRIFGDHKSWRGLLINVIFCTLGTMIQGWLQNRGYLPQWLYLLDYRDYGYLFGIMLGLGMTFGELPNSFLKRQLEILPGKSKKGPAGVAFFLFDQIDLTIGIWLFFFLLIMPSPFLVFWSIVLTGVFHVIISVIGYLLGMRRTIV
jgi:CDP-diglyceride synthetase